MAKIFNRSSGGEPEHKLQESFFTQLAEQLDCVIDVAVREQLQSLVDNILYWGSLEPRGDAKPISQYYQKLEKKLESAADMINCGPVTDDPDVKHTAKSCFNHSRKLEDDPDWIELQKLLKFAAGNVARARENLQKEYTLGQKPGPQTTEWLSQLVNKLVKIAPDLGLIPSASYCEYRADEGKDPRETRFVRLVDAFRKELEPYLREDKSNTISIVRRELDAQKPKN